jgi:hypothetical protein
MWSSRSLVMLISASVTGAMVEGTAVPSKVTENHALERSKVVVLRNKGSILDANR